MFSEWMVCAVDVPSATPRPPLSADAAALVWLGAVGGPARARMLASDDIAERWTARGKPPAKRCGSLTPTTPTSGSRSLISPITMGTGGDACCSLAASDIFMCRLNLDRGGAGAPASSAGSRTGGLSKFPASALELTRMTLAAAALPDLRKVACSSSSLASSASGAAGSADMTGTASTRRTLVSRDAQLECMQLPLL